MKILFLTQVLPYPLDAGPKIRAYYVLRHLAERHEVTLLSFVRDSDSAESIAHLRSLCNAVHTVPMPRSSVRDLLHLVRSLPTRLPFLIARDWVPAMTHALDNILHNEGPFDAVHADQLWMAPYAQRAAQSTAQEQSTLRTVLDQHNAVYLIPQRLAADERNPLKRALLAVESRKMMHYELNTCRAFDRVVWVTSDDHAAVQSQSATPVANAGVIPICGSPLDQPPLVRHPQPCRVTFLGGLHWPPNAEGVRWFVRHVWPQIARAQPHARLTVIGKEPPAEVVELAASDPRVDAPGFVDDVRPLLCETAAFVVPLHAGGGMRVKILDAWAWGLPTVSTSIGAEGTAFEHEHNMLIADEPQAFADAVLTLFDQPQRAAQIAAAGRETIERCYDWRSVYQQWDSVYST